MRLDGVATQQEANKATGENRVERVQTARTALTAKFGEALAAAQKRAIKGGSYSANIELSTRDLRGIPRKDRIEVFMEVLKDLRDTLQGDDYALACKIESPRYAWHDDTGLVCDVTLDWSSGAEKSTGDLPAFQMPEKPVAAAPQPPEEAAPKKHRLLDRLRGR